MIATGVLFVVPALVAMIALRPAEFHIERSAAVDAPAEIVFGLINDFHQWARWSPYEKLDPAMEKTFEGPTSGLGAIYAWSGNNNAGEGRITILDSKPFELVGMKLEFTRPFACTNQVTFSVVPHAGSSEVTWAMEGRNNFIGKAFDLFLGMDKIVGAQFAEGLANLNSVARADAQQLDATAAQNGPAAP